MNNSVHITRIDSLGTRGQDEEASNLSYRNEIIS